MECGRKQRIKDAAGAEAEQVRFYQVVLNAAEKSRIAGVMLWCLYDYLIKNPNESHFGFIRPYGS